MGKVLFLTFTTLLLLGCVSQGQHTFDYLLQTPIHQTEKQTLSFVKAVTKGKPPPLQFDGRYKTYAIQDGLFLIEYKIEGDTCVMAALHFRGNKGLYQKVIQEVKAETKPFGENRLKEVRGRRLIFVFLEKETMITALGFDFALLSVRRKGF
jgi:hypothetical protein